MINKVQKKSIITNLGKQYSPAIIEHLNKKQIFNSKNLPFSPKSIQNIVNGLSDNILVEKQIFVLLQKIKTNKAKELQERKEIIKK